MTRVEAKSILINKVKPCMDGTEWGEALDMAIKALEQEPKTVHWSRDKAESEDKHIREKEQK